MRIIHVFLIVALVHICSGSGFAATMVESLDGDNTAYTMWVEGLQIRVDISNEPEYMLIDAENGKMYSVNTQEKRVVELSNMFQNNSRGTTTEKYQVEFIEVGKGALVAGYATDHYRLIVNKKICSNEYLSKEALQNFESLKVFEALSKISDSEGMGLSMGMMDPCDSARISFDKTYSKLGFPLKIIDRNGTLESEVVVITRNVPPPPGGFGVPAGYEVVDLGQMMQEGMQGYPPEPGGGMPVPEGSPMGSDIDQEKMQQMLQEMMQQMGKEK